MKGSLDRKKGVKCQNVRKDIIEGSWGRYKCVLDEGEDADRGGGCMVE